MSNEWTTVTHKKKKKPKKQSNNFYKSNLQHTKPKIKNYIKEKIIKCIKIDNKDNDIFKTWKHDYLIGNIFNKETNTIFREEDKFLILEYINKFKIYKNYNKIDENEFKKIYKNLTINKDIFLKLVYEKKLYVFGKLLQDKYDLKNIEKNI
jgi:hypothetical protein